MLGGKILVLWMILFLEVLKSFFEVFYWHGDVWLMGSVCSMVINVLNIYFFWSRDVAICHTTVGDFILALKCFYGFLKVYGVSFTCCCRGIVGVILKSRNGVHCWWPGLRVVDKEDNCINQKVACCKINVDTQGILSTRHKNTLTGDWFLRPPLWSKAKFSSFNS